MYSPCHCIFKHLYIPSWHWSWVMYLWLEFINQGLLPFRHASLLDPSLIHLPSPLLSFSSCHIIPCFIIIIIIITSAQYKAKVTHLCLSVKSLLVSNHLERHTDVLSMVIHFHYLSEAAFAQHSQHLVAICDVVVRNVNVRSLVVVVTVVVCALQQTLLFLGIRTHKVDLSGITALNLHLCFPVKGLAILIIFRTPHPWKFDITQLQCCPPRTGTLWWNYLKN